MCYPSACDESFARPCRRPRECARLRPPADPAEQGTALPRRIVPAANSSVKQLVDQLVKLLTPPAIPMAAVQFIVEGEATLSGSIRPSGNKNAALPIIA